MWDTKYRPLKFSDVLGQKGTLTLLKARLENGTALDTNYIFSGGSGRGKTTLARILSRAMLCLDFDSEHCEPCNQCSNCRNILEGSAEGAYVEQDAASGGTIDKIRGLVENLAYGVFDAPKRVYVFDEAHRMSRDAQDVLLKPLEEKKFVGIFCTTEPDKIRGPIRSRCEEYMITPITRLDILERIQYILRQEKVDFEDDALLTVIDYSGGHVRDVVNKIEMIAQMGTITRKNVVDYLQLSVITRYYEVLLNLSNPGVCACIIEELCETITPEDIAAGLSEVAMASFRLAHNMSSNSVYTDKDLATKVFGLYGDHVLYLAKYFLKNKYNSKTLLLCDVINYTYQIEAPAKSSVAFTAQKIEVPSVVVNKESVTKSNYLRSDGVGPVGSGDICALTELDHLSVPLEKPRGKYHETTKIVRVQTLYENKSEEDLDVILTPEQWRTLFEKTWPGKNAR